MAGHPHRNAGIHRPRAGTWREGNSPIGPTIFSPSGASCSSACTGRRLPQRLALDVGPREDTARRRPGASANRAEHQPPLLDVLVHRMVSKDPARRPATALTLPSSPERPRQAGDGYPRPSASHKLTQNERRVMTVLVVVRPHYASPGVSSRAAVGVERESCCSRRTNVSGCAPTCSPSGRSSPWPWRRGALRTRRRCSRASRSAWRRPSRALESPSPPGAP